MIIIDFDDTLFDTQSFKQELAHSLEIIGVSEELFWQSYKKARVLPDGNFSYSFEKHAEILENENFDYEKVFESLNKVKTKIKDFLFADTINFLENLQALDQEMHLLSLGDKNFQEIKVKNCGIEKYFEKLFFVGKLKEVVVQEISAGKLHEEIFFIDDKIEEAIQIKKFFPDMQILLKRSENFGEEEYKKSGFKYFKTLTEIETQILTQIGTNSDL